jgi:hypothetical protein
MKRLLTLFLLCAASAYGQASIVGTATVKGTASVISPAPAGFTFNYYASNGNFGTSVTATVAISVASTSTDLLVIRSGTQGTALSTPTAPCFSTATLRGTPGTPAVLQSVWTAVPTATGACTVSAAMTSAGNSDINLDVYVVHGTTQNFDAISTYQGDTGFCTSCSGTNLVTAHSDMTLVLGYTGSTISALSPYSVDENATPAGSGTAIFAGHNSASSGTYTPTWTSGGAHYAVVSIGVY